MNEEWQLDWGCLLNKSQFKHMAKCHPKEMASCLENLDQVCTELNGGKKIGDIAFGFFRSEKKGLYRIGQTKVKSAHELRLYVFPDERTRTLRILCLGDKNTQQDDINLCHQHATK